MILKYFNGCPSYQAEIDFYTLTASSILKFLTPDQKTFFFCIFGSSLPYKHARYQIFFFSNQ